MATSRTVSPYASVANLVAWNAHWETVSRVQMLAGADDEASDITEMDSYYLVRHANEHTATPGTMSPMPTTPMTPMTPRSMDAPMAAAPPSLGSSSTTPLVPPLVLPPAVLTDNLAPGAVGGRRVVRRPERQDDLATRQYSEEERREMAHFLFGV